jgi:hypothetical protein
MMAHNAPHLGGHLYLGGETDTLITYSWLSGANSWESGNWDVTGLSSVFLELRQWSSSPPIARMVLDFDPDTLVVSGKFDLTETPKRLEDANFKASLNRSSLHATVSLNDDTIQLDGEIVGNVELVPPLNGALYLRLVWSDNSFHMLVDSNTSFSAFGVTCNVEDLRVILDSKDWYFSEISGRVSLSHANFTNGSISIDPFIIRNGELTHFSVSGPPAFNALYRVLKLLY